MRVLPTKWRRKPAGIDTERNYVTVTLCRAYTKKNQETCSVQSAKKEKKYKKKVNGCCLSTLMAVRLSIEAVQHMTSSATHMSHSASPSSHIALFTCNHGNDAPKHQSSPWVVLTTTGWVGLGPLQQKY